MNLGKKNYLAKASGFILIEFWKYNWNASTGELASSRNKVGNAIDVNSLCSVHQAVRVCKHTELLASSAKRTIAIAASNCTLRVRRVLTLLARCWKANSYKIARLG